LLMTLCSHNLNDEQVIRYFLATLHNRDFWTKHQLSNIGMTFKNWVTMMLEMISRSLWSLFFVWRLTSWFRKNTQSCLSSTQHIHEHTQCVVVYGVCGVWRIESHSFYCLSCLLTLSREVPITSSLGNVSKSLNNIKTAWPHFQILRCELKFCGANPTHLTPCP